MLKPMLNLRPFVLLGAPRALELLRSFGFQTFSSVVNESYDTIGDPATRLSATLAEAARLARLPHSSWKSPELLEAIVHNAKHSACGGFKAELVQRAVRSLRSILRRFEEPAVRLSL